VWNHLTNLGQHLFPLRSLLLPLIKACFNQELKPSFSSANRKGKEHHRNAVHVCLQDENSKWQRWITFSSSAVLWRSATVGPARDNGGSVPAYRFGDDRAAALPTPTDPAINTAQPPPQPSKVASKSLEK
jgi:hypothetical protein